MIVEPTGCSSAGGSKEKLMPRSATKARVDVSRNGPYVVSGHIPLAEQIIVTDAEGGSDAWQEGTPVPVQETYALCRCGQSKSPPFCDGTHAKVKFDGTETASREPYLNQAQAFDGPALALLDATNLCAFGRFCDPHGKVWNQVAQTDDPAIRAMFIRQVENCPAGRLVAWDKAADQPIEPALPLSIGLIEDPAEQCSGPLWLRGGLTLVASDGFTYEVRNRVTVCRCGASRNKPFCDGTHATIKFNAKSGG
jgi:CDGSH-type Zn-finger protein